jgi:hypothetical protein
MVYTKRVQMPIKVHEFIFKRASDNILAIKDNIIKTTKRSKEVTLHGYKEYRGSDVVVRTKCLPG